MGPRVDILPFLILYCLITPAASFQAEFLRSLTSRLFTTRDTAISPKPDSNGISSKYALRESDTCQSIAQAHHVTVADIETYNGAVWGWRGCAHIKQGDFICLSSGQPVMPVALPQASCGPQVPGTARPDNYGILSTLNPCPAGQCCTTEGTCVSANACTANQCISDCGTAPVPAPAEPAPKETRKDSTEAAPASTTTQAAPPEPETTAKEKPPTKTTVESPSWTLAAYTWLNCDGDYLIFEGHREDLGKCIDIHGGLRLDSSTGVSCGYYWNGGWNYTDCDSSPTRGFFSWDLTGAKCTAYKKQCDDSGRDWVQMAPKKGCQKDLMRRPHYWMHWGSIKCESV
ncbi:hypothetical protein N7492_004368 [Penicillium capsulatum]|uniref:LysM domain-containing protein n=1 Tax=Penicillium capsulatum TaxID=69766 RepID=A0A9W9LQW6_9EURO|nr:hypothetical protein N7492_004368 [Penicillium capsulatum]KAJ6136513.1 hypothetical protein N7512_001673 [Penicillium capsulatum]